MYKSCWNHSPRTNLQILELAREPQTQNLRCQVPGTWGAHAKTPRVPWVRNYHFLMGKFPKKNLDGNLPEIGGGKKRARFEARRHGQGIFAWATKVNPQGHAVFDKNVGQFLLILLLKNVKKPLNSVQIWLAMVESSINQPIATKMWVSTSALVWHKLQRRLVIRQWKITTFNCKYCKIDCPRSQQWSECIPLFC